MLNLIKSSVTFYEFTHNYLTPDGKLLIGVTSLMKKHGLSPDYSGIPKAILEKAAENGTNLHELLENYDNGKPIKETADLRAYIKLKKDNNLSVDCSEYLISNDVVASKIDKVLSDCSLADLKHTSELHLDALRWQLSIYAYMFEAQNPTLKVPHLYAIHIRSGKAKLIEIERIANKEIERLFACEKQGELYHSPFVEKSFNLCDILNPAETNTYMENICKLADYKKMIERIEETQKILNQKLYDSMEKNKITKVETETFTLSFIAPSVRNSLDVTRLKKDLPDIAEKYNKTTETAGTLRFTYKK